MVLRVGSRYCDVLTGRSKSIDRLARASRLWFSFLLSALKAFMDAWQNLVQDIKFKDRSNIQLKDASRAQTVESKAVSSTNDPQEVINTFRKGNHIRVQGNDIPAPCQVEDLPTWSRSTIQKSLSASHYQQVSCSIDLPCRPSRSFRSTSVCQRHSLSVLHL